MHSSAIRVQWREADDAASAGLKKAGKAADAVLADKLSLEQQTVDKLNRRLAQLKAALSQRLLAADGSLTDFKQFTTSELIAAVDQMMGATTNGIITDTGPAVEQTADLGEAHAADPIRAANVQMPAVKVGLDRAIVTATFENMAVLLSQPMRQFRDDVVIGVRRAAIAGDDKFTQIARLRDTIQSQGIDGAAYRAERIIRTELGRVFNEATYARLAGLLKEFPFLRKGWRATRDSRTRPSHAAAGTTYARGTSGVIPVNALFSVGGAKLRFPVDPLAQPAGKVAAKETIMCRCNSFVDFDLKEYSDFVVARVSTILPDAPPAPVRVAPASVTAPIVPAFTTAAPTAAAVGPAKAEPKLRNSASIIKAAESRAKPFQQKIGTVKYSDATLSAARGQVEAERPPEEVMATLGPKAEAQWAKLMENAAVAQQSLATVMAQVKTRIPDALTLQGPIKSQRRALEKVILDNGSGGDFRSLRDPVRATVAVDRFDQVADAVQAVDAVLRGQGAKIVLGKDRFAKPTSIGYRDLLFNVRFANGTVGEIKVHVKSILAAKEGRGHQIYEEQRKIEERPNPDQKRLAELEAESVKLYGDAWAVATVKKP